MNNWRMISRALLVTLECAHNMRKFYRFTANGATTVFVKPSDEDFIEYIPGVHSSCKPGCDDSTHREF